MNFPWFKRLGILFIPRHFLGWLIALVGVGFSIFEFIQINRRQHSVSDTLINFVFMLLIIWSIYSLIAFFATRKSP
jgi:hypothetical protein